LETERFAESKLLTKYRREFIMSPGNPVLIAIGLLAIGILQAVFLLVIYPYVHNKCKKRGDSYLNDCMRERDRRDFWTASVFLILAVGLSVWNIEELRRHVPTVPQYHEIRIIF
jgi:hypothetical protein